MQTKLNILFIGKKSRINTKKLLPIYLRVTIDGKRFEVTTRCQVEPSLWSPVAGKLKGKSDLAIEKNNELGLLKKQVYDYQEQIIFENRHFSVDSLREKWFEEDRKNRTLLGVFRLSILDLEKLVATGQYCRSTLVKYKTTEKHLQNFLQWRSNGRDILIMDLRLEFAKNFEFYLQTEKSMSVNSSGKIIKNLKKVINDCVDKDWAL